VVDELVKAAGDVLEGEGCDIKRNLDRRCE
jgi:hypothetical protein